MQDADTPGDSSALNSWKREALQTLAAGVAHDINNVLMVVLGNTDLLLMDLTPDHPEHELISGVYTEAQRARKLCELLSGYSVGPSVQLQDLDLAEFVRSEARLPPDAPAGVRLDTDGVAGPAPIRGDCDGIGAVLDDLIANAVNAVETGEGCVYVSVGEYSPADGELAAPHFPTSPPPQGVVLSIRDTGKGMDTETRLRMFDPYFTAGPTKRKGLGLSMAPGIVEAHGGSIHVESEPGAGTTITILFPA